jgi:two-component system chemotaxis response regulator CheY
MARPTNALIVEDEAHVRVFLRMLLKELGIETVWEAADGAQGVALAAQHRPELVLLDINLPLMNGLEVLARLASEQPEIPVIMVTSQSTMKTVLDASKLGAIAYILKHSPKAEALKMLREAIDGLANEDGEGAES